MPELLATSTPIPAKGYITSDQAKAELDKLDLPCDWPLIKKASGDHITAGDLQPCVLCDGDGSLTFRVLDNHTGEHLNDNVLECPACRGEGDLPTLRSMRRLHQVRGGNEASAKVQLVNARRDIEVVEYIARNKALPPGFAERGGSVIIQDNTVDPPRRVDLATNPEEAKRALDEMHTEIKGLEEDLRQLAMGQRALAELQLHVQNAKALRNWFEARAQETEQWLASQGPQAPPPPSTAETHKCNCGKAGYAEDDNGTWWCKRHAHAKGLLERPKDEPEIVLCDWCEQRPSRREHDGYHYCGPCASDADLPQEAAA